MVKTEQYNTLEDREILINIHKDLFLIEEQNIIEGNFLIFSDSPAEIKSSHEPVDEEKLIMEETIKNLENELLIAKGVI